MTTSIAALSIVLSLVFGAGGAGLLAGAQPFAGNMDRLRVPAPTRVVVGVAELCAAAGLLAGLAIPALNVAAAAGLVLLMAGALAYHFRAEDPAKEYAPAVVCGVVAAALLVLHAAG